MTSIFTTIAAFLKVTIALILLGTCLIVILITIKVAHSINKNPVINAM